MLGIVELPQNKCLQAPCSRSIRSVSNIQSGAGDASTPFVLNDAIEALLHLSTLDLFARPNRKQKNTDVALDEGHAGAFSKILRASPA